MRKLDLKKELKGFSRANAKKSNMLDISEGNFLVIEGRSVPSGPAYKTAINVPYSIAYTLKFK